MADIAQRVMDHLFNGACPDAVDGWDQRDPECAACRALDALAAGEPEWESEAAAENNEREEKP